VERSAPPGVNDAAPEPTSAEYRFSRATRLCQIARMAPTPSAPAAPPPADAHGAPGLRRALGTMDGASLTIGAVVGTGIFLTAGDVARSLPHPVLVLGVWLTGGLLVLAGALAYAEMGAMYPHAGGLYHFLRAAWGPLPAFLYGWTCLMVIMTGGIAAIAVGFGDYLGALVPAFSSERTVWAVGALHVNGAQLAALLAIVALTATNHFGVREGASVQNLFTLVKLGAIVALVACGLLRPATAGVDWSAPLPAAPLSLAVPLGVALIATLWTYDGWYALTFSAGEVRDPRRDLPRGLLLGVAVVIVAYAALNLVYLRALGIHELARTSRVAEAATRALFGDGAARAMTAAVAVSAFGCLAATILYSSRIYQPMAADGVFFRGVAGIHPRWRTPVAALWLQSAWAAVLTLTGSYSQLFTYVTFGGVLFHVAAGLALFRLRASRPHEPRPYRAWGWPVVPALFVLGMVLLTVNTLLSAPRESVLGLAAIVAGLPAYAAWRRGSPSRAEPALRRL
jgi:APA family basic amino acid/polyamine antiporter